MLFELIKVCFTYKEFEINLIVIDIKKNALASGKLEIFESNYSFEKIFKELVTLTKIRIDDKSLKLKTSYDSKIPSILRGDKLRVKQVILNVLTNAVKYSEHGTIVRVMDSARNVGVTSISLSRG